MSALVMGDWQEQAACLDRGDDMTPADVQILYRRTPSSLRFIANARSICHACPVIDACRTWVLAHDLDPCPVSIVAAMTPQERNADRRSRGIDYRTLPRQPIAHGTDAGYVAHRRRGEAACLACLAARAERSIEYREVAS